MSRMNKVEMFASEHLYRSQCLVNELTEEMLGYICDALCKHPCNIKDVEKLERVCAECQVENYLANIKLATIKVLESKKKGFKDCISKQEVQLNREWNKAIEACIEAVKAGEEHG